MFTVGTHYESLSEERLLFSPSISAWFYFHRLLLSGPQGSGFWQHWKEEIKMKNQSVREMFWWVCIFLFNDWHSLRQWFAASLRTSISLFLLRCTLPRYLLFVLGENISSGIKSNIASYPTLTTANIGRWLLRQGHRRQNYKKGMWNLMIWPHSPNLLQTHLPVFLQRL